MNEEYRMGNEGIGDIDKDETGIKVKTDRDMTRGILSNWNRHFS